MEDILKQILEKVSKIEESQQETKEILSALKEGQEVAYAEFKAFQEETTKNFEDVHARFDHLDRKVKLLDVDLDGLNVHVKKHQREIEKLTRN
jgi:hypothetical protein